MYCKDCEHWGNDYKNVCSLIDLGFDKIGDSDKIGSAQAAIVTRSADDHNLTSMLVTGSNFGCVKFSSKNSDNELLNFLTEEELTVFSGGHMLFGYLNGEKRILKLFPKDHKTKASDILSIKDFELFESVKSLPIPETEL